MVSGSIKKIDLFLADCNKNSRPGLCSLATCNSCAAEVTSHTLFEEGDVMNVLEEFRYGNLDPAEYDANSGKEYKERKSFFDKMKDLFD